MVAQSFERIHRSQPGRHGRAAAPIQGGRQRRRRSSWTAPRLYEVLGLGPDLKPQQDLTLWIRRKNGAGRDRAGALPHRYPHRGRLLPARRHPAVTCCASCSPGRSAGGTPGRTAACGRSRCGGAGVPPVSVGHVCTFRRRGCARRASRRPRIQVRTDPAAARILDLANSLRSGQVSPLRFVCPYSCVPSRILWSEARRNEGREV